MNRTVSALYDTRADAERALEALRSHGLAEHAEIHDPERSDGDKSPDMKGRLHRLFGGHKDAHAYAEGVRRGHILLTARVGEDKETLAAELLTGAAPLAVGDHEANWRREGWTPDEAAPSLVETSRPGEGEYDSATAFGSPVTVRSYVTGNAIDYSEV